LGALAAAFRPDGASYNQTLDHALAEYLGLDPTAFRCLDILDQEGPMTPDGSQGGRGLARVR
jgi:hypothetical protein